MRSTILQRKLSMSDKPWLKEPDGWERLGWWTTFLVVFLGAGASAAFCLFNFRNIQTLPKTCLVLEDNFDTLDLTTWTRDVELGGFGNGEFQMTTSSPNNSFTRNGQLYILPTLTSDVLGRNAIFDGNNFTLSDCTSTNKSACAVTSNAKLGTVIQPAQSARLSTTRSASIRFGKVEVRAKLPRGDWLWPSIWMLPVNETYGTWPRSGEIDIMQSRGNGPTADPNALIPFGFNTVTSALRFGPLPSLLASITGVQSRRRSSSAFAGGFHTYTLEWDEKYIRISVDGRVNAMLELDFSTGSGKGTKGDFFARGGFPDVAVNGTGEVVVQDPWAMGSRSAPFDQDFYLMINLAVGGTSGWFPDGVGDKPWFDSSATAMRDFALMQDNWAATWPGDADDRAFRMSVMSPGLSCAAKIQYLFLLRMQ
ncbi:concanavalin A-like lectin/glucanase [Rickenella mellea]|uniref:Concanavalin A-like lectin/glucanase n=1 Tax=Rickenella mellea TaxID=50990 RepID=A0A4Y7Q5Q9_9AGAM|nr:concanavalin A-like lectin/glucanase [Rickenella mellea]